MGCGPLVALGDAIYGDSTLRLLGFFFLCGFARRLLTKCLRVLCIGKGWKCW